MAKTGYDIFISYRREGGKNYARTLKPELEKRGFKVFLDFDELKDGVFDKRIMDAISESPIFLVILSQGALDRCINEEDWVRQEILFANESNRHIVPVEVDKTFRGFPSNIPNEIKTVLGQHQFSQIDTETLLQESIDKLVKDRITPHINHKEEETGVEIHIDTDADCNLFRFKTFIKELKAGEDNIVYLNPGKYKLVFVSIDFPDIKESQVYSIASDVSCDILEVSLSERIEAEQARRKAEEDRLKRETLEKMKLYPIPQNGKWGYMDESGNVIILYTWDNARDFIEEFAAIENENGKWGCIDKSGTIVIPCMWKYPPEFSEGLAAVCDEDGQYCYINKKGEKPFTNTWKHAENFHEGLGATQDENGKWGFIDKTGNEVIAHDFLSAYDFNDGIAVVHTINGDYAIDKTGKVVFSSRALGPFREGLAYYCDENDNFGYINTEGEVVIPPNSNWVLPGNFQEGLARILGTNQKTGFIDRTGSIVIPCKWGGYTGGFCEGLADVEDEKGNRGFIDKKGNVIIPLIWENTWNFHAGLALVENESGEKMYIDKKGDIVAPKKMLHIRQ